MAGVYYVKMGWKIKLVGCGEFEGRMREEVAMVGVGKNVS